MHCPRCGQPQVSEETKFCSRCGFPLGLVSEIIAHGGFLPQLADLHKDKKWLTRKTGVVFSVFWVMFFLLILTPIFGIAGVDELSGVCAIIGIFGGLMLLIGSLVLLQKSPIVNPAAIQNELAGANVHGLYSGNQTALPPQQAQAAQSYMPPTGAWKAPNTGELTRPGSVVENTTKLLKKEE